MDNLKWVKKKHCQTFGGKKVSDVTILNCKCDTSKNGLWTWFFFKNNCQYKLTNNGYVVFARENDRIYFKGSNEVEGFKLTCATRFKASVELSEYIGGYSLLFDESMSLYYIDLTKREN